MEEATDLFEAVRGKSCHVQYLTIGGWFHFGRVACMSGVGRIKAIGIGRERIVCFFGLVD